MPPDSEPAPIHITAATAHAGERIDRFLADALGTLSRSRVKALIEEGRREMIELGVSGGH